ncbi:hypothetical protein [Methylobacterium iners]|uniref:Uncharacterized protein n=1 Tax=Methylobacterium iners TaxID=418707 RepID=A0ABQ4RZU4_9HYPH|nr:hypothetical protein [Methylobacterium iners]GJD96221.1 hypothetical protein OCOJLMKI_3440 [Methylobacterium iners]
MSHPLPSLPEPVLPGLMRRRGVPALAAAERLWWFAALGFLCTFVIMSIVQQGDARLLNGESVWAKPLKFALSSAVHFGSIALAVHWLRPAWTASAWMTALAAASVAAAVFEVAYIALQGALGASSHFNVSTPLHAALWSLMAAAAVIVLAPMAVIGLLAALDDRARWPAPVRAGVAVGMLGGALLTLVTAFRMGANMSHFIGAPPSWDSLVPLTGWSWRGADLRPAHFLATHMAQAIPLLSLAASPLVPPRAAIVAVVAFATSWTGLTILVFGNALAGGSLATLLAS